jgi:hypothetical protein
VHEDLDIRRSNEASAARRGLDAARRLADVRLPPERREHRRGRDHQQRAASPLIAAVRDVARALSGRGRRRS